MASGVFDLIHIGHIYYLEEAKKLGDELIVVVACDETVQKKKHTPIMPASDRLKLVEALKPVDSAVLGHDDDMFRIVEQIKPDIIALGYDQHFNNLKQQLMDRKISAKIIVCGKHEDDLGKTRKIIEKIKSRKELYNNETHRDC